MKPEIKVIAYGTRHNVEVSECTRLLLVCASKAINEGFIIVGHGLTPLPKQGDKGHIIFERDKNRGHWQYYPSEKL